MLFRSEKNEEENGQDQNANDIAAAEYATEVENMNKQNDIDNVTDNKNYEEVASEKIDRTNEEWCKMGNRSYELSNQQSRKQTQWTPEIAKQAGIAYRNRESTGESTDIVGFQF